jgi:NDP-sugar pyrophosphorylase family protein
VVRLLEENQPVGSFLYDGYWLDIGRHEDYEQAIREYEQVKHQLFAGQAHGDGRADNGSGPSAQVTSLA